MAIVTTSMTKDFQFIDWDGRPGWNGEFVFSAEPGTLLAYGQKDIRKGRGGVDGYQICLPDGSLPVIGDALAAELRHMPLEKRWRTVAQKALDKAVNRPTESYKMADWEKTRNANAARYSAMLGISNPVTALLAEALGLGETPAQTSATPDIPVIDVSGFGV